MSTVLITLFFFVVFFYFARFLYKWSGGGNEPQTASTRNGSSTTLEFKENEGAEPYCFIFDVETTGLLKDSKLRPSQKRIKENNENFPYIVELAWAVLSRDQEIIKDGHYLINPKIEIPEAAINVHGITNEKVKEEGLEISKVLQELSKDVEPCKAIVGHNTMFDKYVIEAECIRNGIKKPFTGKRVYCTMKMGRTVMKQGKPPKLKELCVHLFGDGILPHLNSHSSLYDTFFTAHCFFNVKNQPGRYWS